jgi:hypothetical protein
LGREGRGSFFDRINKIYRIKGRGILTEFLLEEGRRNFDRRDTKAVEGDFNRNVADRRR